jgi:arylsulfatase A-like enzyme
MHGCIDQRGFDEYFIWNPKFRKTGWYLDSWGEDAPTPEAAPLSPATRSMQEEIQKNDPGFKGPLPHMDYGALPDSDEPKMADTIRADWAVEFLKRDHEKPFFLGFGLYAPHKPNFAPRKYFDLYPLDEIALPEVKKDDWDDLPPNLTKRYAYRRGREDALIEKYGIRKEQVQGYLASLSYADAMIGRVLDQLEKSPYRDNTVIVLWSDNGYHNGEKGLWAKHTLWERTSHVPLIWAGPGVTKGARVDATVSLLDVYPTLTELCGLPSNPDVEGDSLAKALADPSSASDKTVLQTDLFHHSLINQQWRYTRYEDGEVELYNLKKDPNEWDNLAGNSEYNELLERFEKQLPHDPAEPGLMPHRDLRMVLSGEKVKWEPIKGQHVASELASDMVESRLDWCTFRFGETLSPGKEYFVEFEGKGIGPGRICGMALHYHRIDGTYGGMIHSFRPIDRVRNGRIYTQSVVLDSLPDDIAYAKVAVVISQTGKWEDREYNTVSQNIKIGK